MTASLLILVLALQAPSEEPGRPAPRTAEELREKLPRAEGAQRLALLNELGALVAESSPDEAVILTEEAIQLARRRGDTADEAEALITRAGAGRARGEYLAAAEAARGALSIIDEAARPALAARAHNALGLIAASDGDAAGALRHALRAQDLFERAGDRRGLSQAYNNVGNSLRRLGEPARALEFHGRSLALKLERGDRDGAGYSHHNMGEVHLQTNAPRPALQAFRSAEAEWRAVGNTRAMAAALKSQGQALEALGEPQEALERYRSSLTLRRDSVNPRGEAETLLSLGALLLRLGRAAEAAEAYTRAAEIATRLGHKALSADVLGGLAAAEEARGRFDAAQRARIAEVTQLKALRDEDRGRSRSEMRAALELHQVRTRAEGLESDAVARNEELRRHRAERNLALAGAGSLFAVALFALAGYRSKRAAESRLRDQAARLEDALAHVKTLRGLLPLCAWCRKVRNDEGYWKDLEEHVTEHTEAAITHGICPDCRAAQSLPAETA